MRTRDRSAPNPGSSAERAALLKERPPRCSSAKLASNDCGTETPWPSGRRDNLGGWRCTADGSRARSAASSASRSNRSLLAPTSSFGCTVNAHAAHEPCSADNGDEQAHFGLRRRWAPSLAVVSVADAASAEASAGTVGPIVNDHSLIHHRGLTGCRSVAGRAHTFRSTFTFVSLIREWWLICLRRAKSLRPT